RQWGGLVDVPAEFDEVVGAGLIAVLARGRGGEDQVALRASGAYARRLEHAPRAADAASAEAFVPRGSVLITGGTGM
ncbi:hypothetical protein, partial [Streptomyces lonarensis]